MTRSPGAPLVLALAILSAGCGKPEPGGDPAGGSGAPAIRLSATTLSFGATASGADPAPQSVTVTNAGSGTLAAPTASVGYLSGTGWLAPTVTGTAAPYAVSLQPLTAGLAPGSYQATVEIASAGATNAPAIIAVTLSVSPQPPTIALSPAALSFEATAGDPGPAPQAVTVTSGNAGTLAPPTAAVGYASGTGWLSATVGGTAAPFTVTVTPATAALGPGTYQATVEIASAGATNTPASVPVSLTVSPPPPVVVVSPTTLSFTAAEGGPSAAPRVLAVASGNAGTLAPPTAAVGYASGNGWLSATVSGAADPYAVTVTASPGALAAGTYQATVSVASAGATNSPVGVPVQLTVTAPPPTQSVAAASLTAQAAQPGRAVGDPPAVRVLDAAAHPVAGVPVTFEVVAGGGAIAGGAATTGADGVARATSWTLGTSGPQQARAVADGLAGSPVTFDATLKSGAYEVSLLFANAPTVAQGLAFQRARERVEQVVTGELRDVAIDLTGAQMGGCGGVPVHQVVDDLLVVVVLEPIDGAGAILGQAGPCFLRSAGSLPVIGLMRFDTADLATLEVTGRLDAVILHEMLHVVGYGTLWSTAGLVSGAGGADPIFTGAGALDAFVAFNNGGSYPGAKVPVENSGNAGTRDVHWRESVFRNELMTGFISGAVQPLSRTTAASLADQGYGVDLASSDPFDVATAGLRLPGGAPDVVMGDDVLRIPLQAVDADGTVRPLP